MLRAAVIGCGRIGSGYGGAIEAVSHASAYMRDPRVELAAAADIDDSALQHFRKRWGVEQLYGNCEEMFARESIDIVSVCTIDSEHAAVVRAAVNGGVRAIFCEKPLAPNLRAAEELVELCAQGGVELFVGYQRRWEPAHIAVRDFIQSGQLGQLLAINGYYVGGLRHNGCAWINLVRFLVGEIAQVCALGLVDHKAGDASLSIALEFVNGCRGSLLAGDRDAYSLFEVDILGSLGRVRLSDAGELVEAWQVEEDVRYPGFRRLLPACHAWPKSELQQALHLAISGAIDFFDKKTPNISSGAEAVRDMAIVEDIFLLDNSVGRCTTKRPLIEC